MPTISRSITAFATLCLLLSATLACSPRSQREAIAMARNAYAADRCKGVLVRLDQARKKSSKPLDREPRRMEVECSFAVEEAEVAEQKLQALCRDFDWTKDGVAAAVIKQEAVYPAGRVAREIEGSVSLGIEIDDDGRVADARILSSEPPGLFDSPATKAVLQWRYCPKRFLAADTRWPDTATMRFRLPPGP